MIESPTITCFRVSTNPFLFIFFDFLFECLCIGWICKEERCEVGWGCATGTGKVGNGVSWGYTPRLWSSKAVFASSKG